MRDFNEERRQQLIAEELERIQRKLHVPDEVIDLYMQNPVLDKLLGKAIKKRRAMRVW
jgi:hypothetical protein